MNSELPKVLHPLLGKPMIQHVIENIRSSGVKDITVVVGYKGEEVIRTVGDSVSFVWQKEQLGTGHAVIQAESALQGFNGFVVVACGDAPLISSHSFSQLSGSVISGNAKAAVLTMIQQNPKGYGRMLKNAHGELVKIVEEKDATDEQKNIREVNSGTYIFESSILIEGLKSLSNNNSQKEYYLTDVVEYILKKGFNVITIPLADSFEGSGINSKEELSLIENELSKRTNR